MLIDIFSKNLLGTFYVEADFKRNTLTLRCGLCCQPVHKMDAEPHTGPLEYSDVRLDVYAERAEKHYTDNHAPKVEVKT